MNGRPLPFKVLENNTDKHVSLRFQVSGTADSVVIHVKKDFGLEWDSELPSLGSASRGLRVVSETWRLRVWREPATNWVFGMQARSLPRKGPRLLRRESLKFKCPRGQLTPTCSRRSRFTLHAPDGLRPQIKPEQPKRIRLTGYV